jgi:hypothetical protein
VIRLRGFISIQGPECTRTRRLSVEWIERRRDAKRYDARSYSWIACACDRLYVGVARFERPRHATPRVVVASRDEREGTSPSADENSAIAPSLALINDPKADPDRLSTPSQNTYSRA